MDILIADDSALIGTRLAALLAELPGVHLLEQTCDTQTTLNAIQQFKPDIVILDLHMPGGGGFCVLKEMKLAATSPLIIVLTAYASPEYRQICLQLGAAYFFDKTTDIDELLELLPQLQQTQAEKISPPRPE